MMMMSLDFKNQIKFPPIFARFPTDFLPIFYRFSTDFLPIFYRFQCIYQIFESNRQNHYRSV